MTNPSIVSAPTNFQLNAGSACIDAGTNIGLPYNGSAPDIGSFETNSDGSNQSPTINNQSFSINENSANGTAMGTVIASDPDAGQTLTYSILSGNTNGAFAINASTGIITVANSSALNFESTPTFALIIKVQDNGTGSLSSQATITISLININEAPVISNQSFSVNENTANGLTVGPVVASDPDIGQTLSYSITAGNTSNAFIINTSTGTLTVNNSAALIYSVNPKFSLNVRATDNGTGNLYKDATITVNVIQGSNQAPVIINQTFSINENSANGTTAGNVIATDPDAGQTKTFSILQGNTNGAFTINASTGVLAVANSTALNFESTPTFALIIKVQDNGTGSLSSQATITVSLININEAPVISNQSFSVSENTANGITVGTVAASDPDASQTISYSITAGNTSNAFTINSSTGILTVNNSVALIFSVNPKFSLNVRVTDSGTGNLYKEATITVNVFQGSDQAPVIINQGFSINENSANGTTVGNVIATDPDAGQTKTFSILQGNTNGAFTINASSGVLAVANSAALDFEATPTFALIIKVQDNGTGSLSSQATITISLININEAPVISNQSFSIAENSSVGTAVGTVMEYDPDYGQINTFSIISGNTNGAFAINTSTAVITVANSAALDFETTSSFTLVVKVQDNGSGSLSSQATITVSLKAINQAPVISNQSFSVNENTANGLTVGTIVASDPDASQTLSYSITAGNTSNAFTINTSTGKLTVNNSVALIFNINPKFSLNVRVTDNGTGNLYKDATITVNVSQESNQAPVIINQGFSINENSANGAIIGTIIATDPDAGQTKTFSTLQGNTNGAFAINPSTGVLTVANSAALDFESTPTFALIIKVQDNGTGSSSSQATITISLININEAPVISNQSLSIAENSSVGTAVGTVMEYDPDYGQINTFSIISGNTNSAFTINTLTAVISVANSAALDFETTSSFTLVVKAQDNGTGNLSSQATITIKLNDVNEPPVMKNQVLSVVENPLPGTEIGYLKASDPDQGQVVKYMIIGGNESHAFNLKDSTGLLSVADPSKLTYGHNPQFSITIVAQDNGVGSLSAISNVTINLLKATKGLVVYIDPTNENDQAQDGSIIHPFNSWDNIIFEDGGTYLQKRGTIFITPASIHIQNKANITLDAYEYGSNPIIFQEQSDTNAIELDNTRNCIIRNFVIMSNIDGTSCINVTGEMSSDLTIENAQLHGAIYAIKSSSKINNLKVLNTIISNNRRDGIIANDFENIEIANCNINTVNQDWVSDPYAKGSCINLSSLNGKVNIHNNELEHSGTGNSAGVSINGTSIEGLIENNILEGGNISGNQCLDLNNTTGIYMVRYNTIKGSETGINVDADTALIYYNQLIDNSIAIEVKQNKAAAVVNNTFVGNKAYSIESLSGSTIIAKNNVYYLTPTASNVYNLGGTFSSDFNNFNIEKPGFLNGYSTLASWTSANGMDNNSIIEDPLFESIESGDFRIQSNSPCINKGAETGIVNDFFGMSVPQAGLPDIGFCEVSSDSIQSTEESVLSTADLINESNITVYPNPTADIININLAKYADQQVSIKIINMNGYEIHSSFTKGEQKVTINMENEKPGIYLAVITINGQTITRNIIRT
jgi:VCBS repeat-containing protein